jgi:hypothetical protein
MKTITVKITSEKIYTIKFDETIFNKEAINYYEDYFGKEVKDKPNEISYIECDRFDITKDDYPLFNIAKQIAFLKSEYDSVENEGMPPIHETGHIKNKNKTYGAYLTEENVDYEYEFDLNA